MLRPLSCLNRLLQTAKNLMKTVTATANTNNRLLEAGCLTSVLVLDSFLGVLRG